MPLCIILSSNPLSAILLYLPYNSLLLIPSLLLSPLVFIFSPISPLLMASCSLHDLGFFLQARGAPQLLEPFNEIYTNLQLPSSTLASVLPGDLRWKGRLQSLSWHTQRRCQPRCSLPPSAPTPLSICMTQQRLQSWRTCPLLQVLCWPKPCLRGREVSEWGWCEWMREINEREWRKKGVNL